MISLLLTLFISVFSFCPSINRLEDHNENTITINENVPVKNYGSLDEYGIQLYMFNCDLLSNDFIVNFIVGFAGGEGSLYNGFSFLNDTVPSDYIDFDCTAYFLKANIGYVNRAQIISNIRAVRIEKLSASYDTVEGEPFLDSHYRMSFISGYNFVLQIDYILETPLFDDAQHELNGVACVRSYITTDTISGVTPFWCYCENSLDSDQTPLINYYYNTVLEKRITINNERFNTGYDLGKSYGYQEGYNQALADTQAYDTTASTIFNGALEIGLLPVNFFLSIFNFEIFGLNVKSIVSALLTLGVVIIIVRFLFGGKDNDK